MAIDKTKDIKVGGTLHSIATGNIIAHADEIMDENWGKNQSAINLEIRENITNIADEEDITLTEEKKLQLKDRDSSKGMGYRILRLSEDGILTQEMINNLNTIYEIRYDFDLNGQKITIPEGCTLKFNGGKFSNGQITFNKTIINSDEYIIFEDIICSGSILNQEVYAVWFGEIGVGMDSALTINKAIQFLSPYKEFTHWLKLPNYVYDISSSITASPNVNIDGCSNALWGRTSWINMCAEGIPCFIVDTGYSGTVLKNIGIRPKGISDNAYIGILVKSAYSNVIENILISKASVGIELYAETKPIGLIRVSDVSVSNSDIGIKIHADTGWVNGTLIEPNWITCKTGFDITSGVITTIRGGNCEIGTTPGSSDEVGLKVGNDAEVTVEGCIWGENYKPYWARISGISRLNIIGDPHITSGIDVLEDATLIETHSSDNELHNKRVLKNPIISINKYNISGSDGYFCFYKNMADNSILDTVPYRLRRLSPTEWALFSSSGYVRKELTYDYSNLTVVISMNIEDTWTLYRTIVADTSEGRLEIRVNSLSRTTEHLRKIAIMRYISGNSNSTDYSNVFEFQRNSTYDGMDKEIRIGLTILDGRKIKMFIGNQIGEHEFSAPIEINPYTFRSDEIKINEMKIYDQILSTSEIRTLINQPSPLEMPTSGTTENRPISAPAGFQYYDTSIGALVVRKGDITNSSESYVIGGEWDAVVNNWKIIR